MTIAILQFLLSILTLVGAFVLINTIKGILLTNNNNIRPTLVSIALDENDELDPKYNLIINLGFVIVITALFLNLLFLRTSLIESLNFVTYLIKFDFGLKFIYSASSAVSTVLQLFLFTLLLNILISIKRNKELPQYTCNGLSSFIEVLFYTFFISVLVRNITVLITVLEFKSMNTRYIMSAEYAYIFTQSTIEILLFLTIPLFISPLPKRREIRDNTKSLLQISGIMILVILLTSIILNADNYKDILGYYFDYENCQNFDLTTLFFTTGCDKTQYYLVNSVYPTINAIIVTTTIVATSIVISRKVIDKSVKYSNSEDIILATDISTPVRHQSKPSVVNNTEQLSKPITPEQQVHIEKEQVKPQNTKQAEYTIPVFLEFFILSTITCGIYYIYHSYKTQVVISTKMKITSPFLFAILSIFTFPFAVIAFYIRGTIISNNIPQQVEDSRYKKKLRKQIISIVIYSILTVIGTIACLSILAFLDHYIWVLVLTILCALITIIKGLSIYNTVYKRFDKYYTLLQNNK